MTSQVEDLYGQSTHVISMEWKHSSNFAKGQQLHTSLVHFFNYWYLHLTQVRFLNPEASRCTNRLQSRHLKTPTRLSVEKMQLNADDSPMMRSQRLVAFETSKTRFCVV
jgi:hypothetical protein